MTDDFQLAWHVDVDSYPEWGSAPRKPLVQFDMGHKGEWMESVIGADVVTGKPMVYHVVRCELCIAIHVWPLPQPEALAKYYATEFYDRDKPDYVARYEADRQWWEQCVHGPILQQCKDFLRLDCPEENTVHFLDIGTGPGIALDVAQKRFGWETWGLEPNVALCEALRTRDHFIVSGTLEAIEPAEMWAFSGERFHVVMLYETLEHQICPEETLLRIWELLEPGGLLVIVVPNDYNPIQLAAQAKLRLPSYWLAPPQHLFFWTPKTLQLCIRRAGFQILDMRGTFPLDKFLLEGYNYIGHDDIGRLVHAWRMQDELHAVEYGQWAQREQEYRFNLTQRIGREIVCVARKIG